MSDCHCGCGDEPLFAWCDGIWTSGQYCLDYARDRLPAEDDLPAYGTSAGVVPLDGETLLKTQEDLAFYGENNE
jgi:hypothetical protein